MRENNGFGDTVAIRHEIEKIRIYEVTETELAILESYSIFDVFFDVAIATTPLFISTIVTIGTLDFSVISQKVKIFLIALAIATGVLSLIFWIIWYYTKKDKFEIIKQIKDRKAKTES